MPHTLTFPLTKLQGDRVKKTMKNMRKLDTSIHTPAKSRPFFFIKIMIILFTYELAL